MAVIQVQSVQKEVLKKQVNPNRKLWATVCYYYPQYTLKEASELPYRDLVLLLNTARKLRASEHLMLLNIAASPHTKDGKGVNELRKKLKEEIE